MGKQNPKVVMVIVAHPDDVEFGCGATVAKLASEGARVISVIATLGNRGSRHHQIEQQRLVQSRKTEQLAASKILGVGDTLFLGLQDGELEANLTFKEQVVKLIRQYKPDLVFTHDPSWFYREDKRGSYVNHSDHRECGKAVLDAIYPLSRDLLSFPHHLDEGLTPHKVTELYLFFPDKPNFYFNVSQTFETKITAINAHKSQIDQPKVVDTRMRDRAVESGKKIKVEYAEAFVKLTLL